MIFETDTVRIIPGKTGVARYTKTSYPVRYGIFSEVETKTSMYQFNLNGEISFLKRKGESWPDPQEWLKRNSGNDWIYYSTGGYTGVFEAIGEYYLPNLQYPTNSLLGGNPFAIASVKEVVKNWYGELLDIFDQLQDLPEEIDVFIKKVKANDPDRLRKRAEKLFAINGGRMTVLPPDARHVDYNVIPLAITRGCRYKCRFCRIKTPARFTELSLSDVTRQLYQLKEFYGDNCVNYNAVFLGEQDSLLGSRELLLDVIAVSQKILNLRGSYMYGQNFFLFGSVDALLEKKLSFFNELNGMGANIFINVGLESADQSTLDILGKPITAQDVTDAFFRIQKINDRFSNIEISANFLMDESLPDSHYLKFLELCRDSLVRKKPKGTIYLSPLSFASPSRKLVYAFNRLKLLSRLPTYLYIIQRL